MTDRSGKILEMLTSAQIHGEGGGEERGVSLPGSAPESVETVESAFSLSLCFSPNPNTKPQRITGEPDISD
jgi:hypothetical protein